MVPPFLRPQVRRTGGNSLQNCREAFTLIEVMVAAAIIAVLALLVTMGITRVQTKSLALNCLARERAIATAVRTYAAGWSGWTHPNGHDYPSLFGHPAYDPDRPERFDEDYARSVQDFRCPVDQPGSLRESIGTGGYLSRGYLRSYNLASAFQGINFLRIGSPAKAVMVHERNQPRHPNGVKLGTNYVYADLSGGVTGGTIDDPAFLPGLMTNWYSNVSLGSNGITTSGLPDLVMVWSEGLRRGPRDRLDFLPTIGSDWDKQGGNDEPNWLLGKWSGYLELPAAGNWTIGIQCDDVGGIWLDSNRDDRVQSSEYTQQGTRQSGDGSGHGWWIRPVEHRFTVREPGFCRVFLYFFEWRGPEHFQFWWRNDRAGINRRVIPVENMWHNPFGDQKPFREPINFSLRPEELP